MITKKGEHPRKFTKVTMGLTDRDFENVKYVENRMHSRSRASAVSSSLSLARTLLDLKRKGGKILVENSNGSVQEIVIPET